MSERAEYIVICENLFDWEGSGYSWDGVRFASSRSAWRHGFETTDDGQFYIGSLEAGRLVDLTWMGVPANADIDAINAALFPAEVREDVQCLIADALEAQNESAADVLEMATASLRQTWYAEAPANASLNVSAPHGYRVDPNLRIARTMKETRMANEAAKLLTADDVRERLRREIAKAGSMRAWAAGNGVSVAYVSRTLAEEKEPTEAILAPLKLRRFFAYAVDGR